MKAASVLPVIKFVVVISCFLLANFRHHQTDSTAPATEVSFLPIMARDRSKSDISETVMSLGTTSALRAMQGARAFLLTLQGDDPGALAVQPTIGQLEGAIALLEQEDTALLTALRTIVQALAVGCHDCAAKQREALVRRLERATVEGEG